MKKRLIDADAVVFDFSGLASIAPYDFAGIAEYLAAQIRNAPTVDAVEVIHAHYNSSNRRSECGAPGMRFVHGENKPIDLFCWNCGARMDEKDQSETSKESDCHPICGECTYGSTPETAEPCRACVLTPGRPEFKNKQK